MTLRIEIPKTKVSLVLLLLKALGVKIISDTDNNVLQELEESLTEAKAIKEGKLVRMSLSEALRD